MATDENTNIKLLKSKVEDFVVKRNWKQFHTPRNLSVSLAIEAAELMEIFQWKNDSDLINLETDSELTNRIKEELADVIIYSLSMANSLDIDVTEAIHNKLELNSKKYPIDKAYGKSEKYTNL